MYVRVHCKYMPYCSPLKFYSYFIITHKYIIFYTFFQVVIINILFKYRQFYLVMNNKNSNYILILGEEIALY